MRRALVPLLLSTVLLAAAACSDVDSSVSAARSENIDSPASPTDAPVSEAQPPDETASDETASDESASEETTGGVDSAGQDAESACEGIVILDEAAVIFGGSAEFDPSSSSVDEGFGSVSCTWRTVDTESELQIISVLFTDGSRPPDEFLNPALYPESEPIELGDTAFLDESNGVTVGFISGERAALVSWFSFEMGAEITPAQRDAVIELARAVEPRI